jgi:flagellar basal-body rod protein FlgF
MDNTLYVGLSRQVTLQRALDITANNLANADTAGFKFESLIVNADPLDAPAPTNTPVQYVLDTGLARNFAPGTFETTGNPLDLAVEGDAFFTVQTAQGPLYTRDGRFAISADGALVDKNGNAVQAEGGSAITLDVKKSSPSIGRDGTVMQDGVQVGKITMVRFADRGALSKTGDNRFFSPASNPPLPATDSQVRQGVVEHSNVTPVTEVTHLISISRQYERIAAMMNAASDLSKQAIGRLGRVA